MSRIGYFASPIILVGLSTAYLFYKKWSSGSKYSSNAEIESVAVSLKKRRSILLLLTAFETLGWLYQFIQFSLGSDNQDPYHSLNLAIQFITWVCELLYSITKR